MNIKKFLDDHQVPYRVYQHARTFDAQHLAAALHIPGANVAKSVLLHVHREYRYSVFVLPACEWVDLNRVSKLLDGAQVQLASESELAIRCPDCEFGILPPFGSQIGAYTIVDESLTQHEDIIFQGDTHTEAIRLKYSDFRAIERPLIACNVCGPAQMGGLAHSPMRDPHVEIAGHRPLPEKL